MCVLAFPAPMASQDFSDERGGSVAADSLSAGMEVVATAQQNTGKACPVHTPGAKEAKRGFRKVLGRHTDYVKIALPEAKGQAQGRLPMEWWKTLLAFFYAAFNLVLTTVMITVVHERVPAKESSPPLPDKFFDYIDRVNWAFTVTEVNGMVLVTIWLVQLFFFKYR